MTAPAEPAELTAEEIATEWGIAQSTVSKWHKIGLVSRRKEGKKYVHPRREVAAAYYTTATRIPDLDTMLEETEFFLSFGIPIERVLVRLAESYSMAEKSIRIRLIDHYPELRRKPGAAAYLYNDEA